MDIKNLSLDSLDIAPVEFKYLNQSRDWFDTLDDGANPLEDCQEVTSGVIDIKCFEGSVNILIDYNENFGGSEYVNYTQYPEKECGISCFGEFEECVEEFLGVAVGSDAKSSYWLTSPFDEVGCEKTFNVIPLKNGLVQNDTRFCPNEFRNYNCFNCERIGVLFDNELSYHNFKSDEYVLEIPSDFTATSILNLNCHDFPCGSCPENSISIFWMNGGQQVCSWLGENKVWMDRNYGVGAGYGDLDSVLYEDSPSSLILEPDGIYLIKKPESSISTQSEVSSDNLIFSSGCVESGVLVDTSENEIEVNFRN